MPFWRQYKHKHKHFLEIQFKGDVFEVFDLLLQQMKIYKMRIFGQLLCPSSGMSENEYASTTTVKLPLHI